MLNKEKSVRYALVAIGVGATLLNQTVGTAIGILAFLISVYYAIRKDKTGEAQ